MMEENAKARLKLQQDRENRISRSQMQTRTQRASKPPRGGA
jgi:hypothetical protein